MLLSSQRRLLFLCGATEKAAEIVSVAYPHRGLLWLRKSGMSLASMNLLRLRGFPILGQLHLEERLLRTSSDNWCILNDGTTAPTIVMGISGNPSELIEVEAVLRDQIPVIRRFSGGGTVIVDDKTIFVTFICNKDAITGLQPYPRPIMSWTGKLYTKALHGIGDFHLRETDYAFGNTKFGGNAQSITKNRWIHHTSFLWDYDFRNMGYLKHPKRAPEYRLLRHHTEFLCKMNDYLPSRSSFMDRTVDSVKSHFSLKPVLLDAIPETSGTTLTHTTKLLPKQQLEAILTSQFQEDSQLLSLTKTN